MRYRGSTSNNPNTMFQDECDRRVRPGGGAGGGKDSRGGFNRNSRSNRDGDRPSSSYRDKSQDRRNSYNPGSDQYQSYSGSSSSSSYAARSVGQPVSGGQNQSNQQQGQFVQAPPPSSGGPMPLMTQQFASQQAPLMGFIGQPPPYPFAPPPPPGPPPPRK